jgi:hypothetical protein
VGSFQTGLAGAADRANDGGEQNTFTGLTPGVVYNVEANAVGAVGPSDWSAPVPQMAM